MTTSKLNDFLTGLSRTVVPIVVGWLIAFALRHGVDLSGHATEITAAAGAAYYALAHGAERFIDPAFGWLLGVAKTPTYRAVTKAAKTSGVNVGTVSVKVEADMDHLFDSLAAHLHSAGDAIASAKPKPATKPKKKTAVKKA